MFVKTLKSFSKCIDESFVTEINHRLFTSWNQILSLCDSGTTGIKIFLMNRFVLNKWIPITQRNLMEDFSGVLWHQKFSFDKWSLLTVLKKSNLIFFGNFIKKYANKNEEIRPFSNMFFFEKMSTYRRNFGDTSLTLLFLLSCDDGKNNRCPTYLLDE